jgi:tetratricopeptide (TPR) repeat protein
MRACFLSLLALPLSAQLPAAFDEAFFKGDPKAIMVACADKARVIKPNDSRLLAEFGRAYLAAGDAGRAEDAFTRAVASDPKDAETYRLIAFAWLRHGRKPQALKALEDMQRMDPKAKNAFTKAAVNLLDAGAAAEAEALMEKAWQLDPKDWQNCADYVRAAVRVKKPELAARWAARTVTARPKEERMWNELALAFADGGALQ